MPLFLDPTSNKLTHFCSKSLLGKGKGKGHACTGTEALYRQYGPLGGVEVYLYPFMTTALEGVRGQRHAPAALYPQERPGTHCTGGWVGSRAGLDIRG
jgi:hypothetical protein